MILLPHVFAQSQYDVTIKYSAHAVTGIGDFNTAPPGQQYLILSLQITNNNYTEVKGGFYVNPEAFYVIVSQVQYSIDDSTFALEHPLPEATVLPGGTITGQISFLVPGSNYGIVPKFQPTYQFDDTTPNINCVQT